MLLLLSATETGLAAANLSASGIKFLIGGAIGTAAGVILGVAIDLIFPSSADASTPEAQYLKPENFSKFVKLPEDQMLRMMAAEPQLEALVIKVAGVLEAANVPAQP